MTKARTPRSTGVPIHLTTESGDKFILERAGGPDSENIDGPEQFLILEQRGSQGITKPPITRRRMA